MKFRRREGPLGPFTVLAAVVLVVAAVAVLRYYAIPNHPSGSASENSTSVSTSASRTLAPLSYTVGTAQFSSQQLELIRGLLDSTLNSSVTQSNSFYSDFYSLFSARHFSAASEDFQFFLKTNRTANPEMYHGQSNGSVLTYDGKLLVGSQAGLMFVYVQVGGLYGSPFGNATDRGSNQLTIYGTSGSGFVGLGDYCDMLPGILGKDHATLLNGSMAVTDESLDVFAYQNTYLGNQTYYVGPPSLQYPLGTGSYSAQNTFKVTGALWAGSVILGGSASPNMTSYLFVVNSSSVLEGFSPELLSLQTSSPFWVYNSTTALRDYSPLYDNYPGHSLYGPLALDPSQGTKAALEEGPSPQSSYPTRDGPSEWEASAD